MSLIQYFRWWINMFTINTQPHDGEAPARPVLSKAARRPAFTSIAGTRILRELEALATGKSRD